MWFKQLKIFQLIGNLPQSKSDLAEQLSALLFQSCLPTMPATLGWVPPVPEESEQLVREINGCQMICLQLEEKILPAIVIRQALEQRVNEIAATESRKVYAKEKQSLKDDIQLSLLPRAFSKLTRIYGYLDLKNRWLMVGTHNAKKLEQFLTLFQKTVELEAKPLTVKPLSPLLTQWLLKQNYPHHLAVEKAALLQDPRQKNRTVRCQQQDLFAQGIQAFIQEGCVVKQVALSWQDRVQFVIADDFTISGLKFEDSLLAEAKDHEAETKGQQFDTDFLIMTGTLAGLARDLLALFQEESAARETEESLQTASVV